jgi:hypothetical protein
MPLKPSLTRPVSYSVILKAKAGALGLQEAKTALRAHANPEKAKFLRRFFKTGKGQYASGDRFIGVVVPHTRKVANAFRNLLLPDVVKLLRSRIHEERLLALIILTLKYAKSDDRTQQGIFDLYVHNLRYVSTTGTSWMAAPLPSSEPICCVEIGYCFTRLPNLSGSGIGGWRS